MADCVLFCTNSNLVINQIFANVEKNAGINLHCVIDRIFMDNEMEFPVCCLKKS